MEETMVLAMSAGERNRNKEGVSYHMDDHCSITTATLQQHYSNTTATHVPVSCATAFVLPLLLPLLFPLLLPVTSLDK